jgi:hypothetical protein
MFLTQTCPGSFVTLASVIAFSCKYLGGLKMIDGLPDTPAQKGTALPNLEEAIKELYGDKPSAIVASGSRKAMPQLGEKIELSDILSLPARAQAHQRAQAITNKETQSQSPGKGRPSRDVRNPAYQIGLGLASSSLSFGTSAALFSQRLIYAESALARFGTRSIYLASAITLADSTALDYIVFSSKSDWQADRAAKIGLGADAVMAGGLIVGALAGRGTIGISLMTAGLLGKLASGLMYHPYMGRHELRQEQHAFAADADF